MEISEANRDVCEYCAGWTVPDRRGNCSCCGAPKKPVMRVPSYSYGGQTFCSTVAFGELNCSTSPDTVNWRIVG